MLDRTKNAKTREISEMASLLSGVARQFVRVSAEDQKALDVLQKRAFLKPGRGMTAKNRERTRPFDDPAIVKALLNLPERLFSRSAKKGDSYGAALEWEEAVAIAILLYCPIRRTNVASIHLEKNLQRFGKVRVFLLFEADEVKNSERIEFELPAHIVDLIDRHLAIRSPTLCPPGTPWLFPKRDGSRAMDPGQLAARIKKRVFNELGLEVNAHLFRHIAAKLFLAAKPGHYEALRRLLGHKELSQTINAYAGFEAGTAIRLFANVLEEAKR